MATRHNIAIPSNGLVWAIDPASSKNYTANKSTNLLSNGGFAGGADATPSGGHNAQNDIVQYANPGDSEYVLRQTMGIAQTEYQCNPTIPSGSSQPICMSGYYSYSTNYSGANRMFHSRAYSSGGSHTSLGTGIGTQLSYPVELGGQAWTARYAILNSPSDANGTFNWYVGYAGASYSGARYYTNLCVEVGRAPAAKNLAGNVDCNVYSTASGLPVQYYAHNGSNGYIDTNQTASQHGVYDNSYTMMAWLQVPNTSGDKMAFGTNQTAERQGLHHGVRGGNFYFGHYGADTSASGVVANKWHCVVWRFTKTSAGVGTANIWVDGTSRVNTTNIGSFIGTTNIWVARHWGFASMYTGQMYMYDRALTDNQIVNMYHATKGRHV